MIRHKLTALVQLRTGQGQAGVQFQRIWSPLGDFYLKHNAGTMMSQFREIRRVTVYISCLVYLVYSTDMKFVVFMEIELCIGFGLLIQNLKKDKEKLQQIRVGCERERGGGYIYTDKI